MHNAPDREFRQLCESEPFRLFCRSPLPTADQRVICRSCGLETDESGHVRAQGCPGGCVAHRHTSAQMWPDTPPEQRHEQMGHPPWEAPYVWETDYL